MRTRPASLQPLPGDRLDYLSTREQEEHRGRRRRPSPCSLVPCRWRWWAIVAFVAGAAIGAPGSPGQGTPRNRFRRRLGRRTTSRRCTGKLNDLLARRGQPQGPSPRRYRDAELTATQRGPSSPAPPRTPLSRERRHDRGPDLGADLDRGPSAGSKTEIDLPYAEGGIDWGREPGLPRPPGRRKARSGGSNWRRGRAILAGKRRKRWPKGPVTRTRTIRWARRMIDVTRRSRRKRRKKTRHCSPGRATRRKTPVGNQRPREAPSTAASPASRAASCWRWPVKGGGHARAPWPKAKPEGPAHRLKTTIDPALQGRRGRGARRTGRRPSPPWTPRPATSGRPSPGQAFSAPQPPGSTFKMVTTTAGPAETTSFSLEDEFEINNGINVGGRFLNNANGEYCGGHLPPGFRPVVQLGLSPPLGPKIGNDALVRHRRTLRLQLAARPSTRPQIVREGRTGRIDDPEGDRRQKSTLGVSAIGQGEVLATPLEMATVAQRRSPTAASARPTSIVNNKKLRPRPRIDPGECRRSSPAN